MLWEVTEPSGLSGAACLPGACEGNIWDGTDFRALRRAAYMGYEGWSDVTDYCILRRVLELRDSPLAGECAVIIKAHRPDARCADIPLGSLSGICPVLLLAPDHRGIAPPRRQL